MTTPMQKAVKKPQEPRSLQRVLHGSDQPVARGDRRQGHAKFGAFACRIAERLGKFQATAEHDKAAGSVLDELLKWAEALLPLRQPQEASRPA